MSSVAGVFPLITVDELSARLAARNLRIFDVRWYLADPQAGRVEYGDAHIPGAVFVDLETQLSGQSGPGRHPLPSPKAFTETLRELGVDKEHHVVVYDASAGAIASRMWWMLRSAGHRAVQVLDGGFVAWRAAGQPTTGAVPKPRRGHYPTIHEWTGVVGAEDVARTDRPLIDARAADRYTGEHEPIDRRAGHIPGAINLPFVDNLSQDAPVIDRDAVRERFAGAEGAIVYCGSGVTACHDLLAMEVAGIPGGLLYEGSWSDWSSDPGRPIATGTEPR